MNDFILRVLLSTCIQVDQVHRHRFSFWLPWTTTTNANLVLGFPGRHDNSIAYP